MYRRFDQPFYPVQAHLLFRSREVRGPRGEPVCVTVYERGAAEVVRRLAA